MDDAIDPAAGRRALSKASWRILPLLAFGYGFAFIDRANISFAAQRMNYDLHFSASVYGLGAGLFFLSYAAFEVPSNLLLVRFGARRWIARIMITWGILAAAMMFVRTPMQFYVVRFLLGLAEAGYFPGVIYYLTQWFPMQARGRAISRFYVAWPLSTVVMGAVAGTLLGLDGTFGIAGWQWLFLVEGIPAVAMGVVILFLLPDSPDTVTWLTPAEKHHLKALLAADWSSPLRNAERGILHALLDPFVLGFAVINTILLGSYYAFNLTAPEFLGHATHFDVATVGYLVAIGGILGAFAMVLNGWNSDRTRERFFHLAAPLLTSALAYGLLGLTSNTLAVIALYWVVVMSNAAIGAVYWLAPGEVIAPRAMAVSVAAMNAIGQLGSFVSPILWGIAKDATGSYRLGISILPIGFVLAAIIVLWLRRKAMARTAQPARVAAEAA